MNPDMNTEQTPCTDSFNIHTLPKLGSLELELDPFGWKLMNLRIESIPPLLTSYLRETFPSCCLDPGNVRAVGVGSSRAHAEYLRYLFERHIASSPVSVCDPLTYIESSSGTESPCPNMIIFSQGLSPNTHAAIRNAFGTNSFLFTSTFLHSIESNDPKNALLREISSSGIKTISYPLSNEFEILPRFIGPFMGYVAVYRFVHESLLGGENHDMSNLDFDAFFSSAKEAASALSDCCREHSVEAFHLISTFPFYALNHNLKEKIRECLLPTGTIESSSITEYEHGRFQQNCNPRSAGMEIILTTQDRSSTTNRMLTARTSQAAAHSIPIVLLESPYNAELSVLWFEMVFNNWLQSEVQSRGINLRDWPGKTGELLGATNYSETGE